MNNLCRTCLSQTNNLFSTNESKSLDFKIIKMISFCAGLEVSKLDSFSNKICNTCFNKLQDAYIFRQLCWRSHGYFVKKFSELNEYEIKPELHTNEIAIEHIKDEKESNEFIEIEIVNRIEENIPKSKFVKDKGKVNTRHCYMCSRTFCKLPTLKDHLISVHKTIYNEELIPDEEKNCNLCDEQFDTVQAHRKHMLKHSTQDRKSNKHIKDTNKVKARECYLCPESFFKLPLLKKHLLRAHKVKYNEELIPVEAKTCKICNKQVDSFEALRGHVKRHSEQTPGVCDLCGKKFKLFKNLKQHLQIHTGEKPYKCDKCDYRSNRKSTFVTHQLKHSNERKYECSICHKMFKRPSHLRGHMFTHTDERPVICHVCQKTFKNSNDCTSHMKIHDATKHLSCSYCDKKFASAWNLKTHLKQHTGDRPHSCEICGKGFIQMHCWRTHMNNHHNKIV